MEPPPLTNNKRRNILVLSGALVLLLSLGIGLGVGLSNSDEPNNHNPISNTPTPDPVGEKTSVEDGYTEETLKKIQQSVANLKSHLDTEINDDNSGPLYGEITQEKTKLDGLLTMTIPTGGFTSKNVTTNIDNINKRYDNELVVKFVEIINFKKNKVLSVLNDNNVSQINDLKVSLRASNDVVHAFTNPLINQISQSVDAITTVSTTYINGLGIIQPIQDTISNLKTEIAHVKGNPAKNSFTHTIRGEYNKILLSTIPESFETSSKSTNDLIKDYYEVGYEFTTLELNQLKRDFNKYIADLAAFFGRTDRDESWIGLVRLNLSKLKGADKDSFFRSKETIDLYQITQAKLYEYQLKLAEHFNSAYVADTTSTTATDNLINEMNNLRVLLAAEKTTGTKSYYLNHLNELAKKLVGTIIPAEATEEDGGTDFNVAMRNLKEAQQGLSTTIVTRANTEVKETTSELKQRLDITDTRGLRNDLINNSNSVETLKLDLERTIPLIGETTEEISTKNAAQTEINRTDAWITKLYNDWGADSLGGIASDAASETYKTEGFYRGYYKVKNYTRYVDFSIEQTSTSGRIYHTFTTKPNEQEGIINWYPNKLEIIALNQQILNIETVKNTFSLERINKVIMEAETLLTNTIDKRINDDTIATLETALAELKIRQKEVSLKLNTFKLKQYIKSKNTTKITETVKKLQTTIATIVPADNLSNVVADATSAINDSNSVQIS